MDSQRREPSPAMVQRMSANAPERAEMELIRSRMERDRYRKALIAGLDGCVQALRLKPTDVLVVKRLLPDMPDSLKGVVEDLRERLVDRAGFHGLIVVMSANTEIEAMDETEARGLYEALQRRFE